MSARIAADSDAYGKYARLSALADYLEVRALKQQALSRAGLADLLADSGWQLPDLIQPPEDFRGDDLSELQDQSRDAADRVMSVVRERADALGDGYPFELVDDRLQLRAGMAPLESPYVALLGITVSHAYGLCENPAPHDVFEEVVEQALRARLEYAVNFGRVRRGAANFDAAVDEACPMVLLKGNPRAGWRMKRAQDEKVDAIAHFSWADQRPGVWTFIGQATCGKSESWEMKIKEPSEVAWGSFLGVTPVPQVFLAVPHHVETMLIHKLVQDSQRVILDRLRLARFKGENTAAEKLLTERMLDAEFDEL